MENRPVLGIDFGTTNSYFCKYLTHPNGQKIRLIDFSNGQLGGIPSTILYRKGKSPIIGKTAEMEWGEATPAERANYKLSTHFKPDIHRSETAKIDAINFLKTLREQTEARRIELISDDHLVIFGVPGEADELFRETVSEIAEAAGFGKVRLVAEPIGALLYHLWNKDISPSETQNGVLVVDFGGGTCDFSYMQRLEVIHAWGDMILGGRLFDDLFFQWFLDQNPGALEELIDSGNEYYVHWLECRQIKELFSETMAHSRKEVVRGRLGTLRNYGVFNSLTWEEFIERASNYRPHPTFVAYLKERGIFSSKLTSGESIDLLKWFRQSLIEGLEKNAIRSGDIERVILTGGSSQWPFVQDIICESLHISPQQLLTSENPKAAISEGLVVLPALQITAQTVSEKLRSKMPQFFAKRIEPEIDSRINAIIEEILRDITVELYDKEIFQAIRKFRDNGGKLKDLKENIRNTSLQYVPKIEKQIREKLGDLFTGLPEMLHREVQNWFKENGISYLGKISGSSPGDSSAADAAKKAAATNFSGLQNELTDALGLMLMTISAAIVGTISGGTGTALIASGPVGWLIGAVAAAVAVWVGIEVGRNAINEQLENQELPAWLLKLVLRDSKITSLLKEGRDNFEDALFDEIEKAIEKPLAQLHQQVTLTIEREIKGLSLINHI
jgi:hypothetical protein